MHEEGFGLAPLRTEGAEIWYDPDGPRIRSVPLSPWMAFWRETRKRVLSAWWALRGDSGC